MDMMPMVMNCMVVPRVVMSCMIVARVVMGMIVTRIAVAVAVIVGVRMNMVRMIMGMPPRRGRNEGLAADDPPGRHDDMPDRVAFLVIVSGRRRHMRMGMGMVMPVIVARMVVIVAMVLGGFWRRGIVTAGGGRLGRFGHDRGAVLLQADGGLHYGTVIW